jgi:serine/threonine protein phosphatase 1
MSDIHGCYDDFICMLKQINFSDDDQLILAGDYIDRGTQNYEMLKWLENAPYNVLLIKGNHDVEFVECISIISSFITKFNVEVRNNEDLLKVYQVIKDELKSDMFDYYGTLKQLIIEYDITLSDLNNWKEVIDSMSYYCKININGHKHIIAHAGYISNEDYKDIQSKYSNIESFYIYAREDSIKYGKQKDATIIFGHTPTLAQGIFYNDGNVYKYIDAKNNCSYYNIDCGKVYHSEKHKNAKLACIRLEDKKIFYI